MRYIFIFARWIILPYILSHNPRGIINIRIFTSSLLVLLRYSYKIIIQLHKYKALVLLESFFKILSVSIYYPCRWLLHTLLILIYWRWRYDDDNVIVVGFICLSWKWIAAELGWQKRHYSDKGKKALDKEQDVFEW